MNYYSDLHEPINDKLANITRYQSHKDDIYKLSNK